MTGVCSTKNVELVVPGVTGEWVPPDDPGRLAQAMVGLMEDTAQARAMGREGRKRVEAQWSLEAMMRGYEAVYRRMLAG